MEQHGLGTHAVRVWRNARLNTECAVEDGFARVVREAVAGRDGFERRCYGRRPCFLALARLCAAPERTPHRMRTHSTSVGIQTMTDS